VTLTAPQPVGIVRYCNYIAVRTNTDSARLHRKASIKGVDTLPTGCLGSFERRLVLTSDCKASPRPTALCVESVNFIIGEREKQFFFLSHVVFLYGWILSAGSNEHLVFSQPRHVPLSNSQLPPGFFIPGYERFEHLVRDRPHFTVESVLRIIHPGGAIRLFVLHSYLLLNVVSHLQALHLRSLREFGP
jgi:hypothetical protein